MSSVTIGEVILRISGKIFRKKEFPEIFGLDGGIKPSYRNRETVDGGVDGGQVLRCVKDYYCDEGRKLSAGV